MLGMCCAMGSTGWDTIRVLDVFGVAASARSRYLVACATIRRELAGGLPHQEGAAEHSM